MMMSPQFIFSQASIFQCFSPSLTISGYNLHGNGIYTVYLYIFFLHDCRLAFFFIFPSLFLFFVWFTHNCIFRWNVRGEERKTKKRKGRPAGWWLKLGNIRKRDENYSAKTKTKEKHRRARGYTTTEWERERPEIHESQFSTPGSDLNGKIISGWEKDTALTARRVHVVVSISSRRKTYIPFSFSFLSYLTLAQRIRIEKTHQVYILNPR